MMKDKFMGAALVAAWGISALAGQFEGANGARAAADGIYLPPYRAHDWRAGWIWHGTPMGTRYFRKTVDCRPDELRLAAAQWVADDRSEMFVNGTSVGTTTSWARPTVRENLLPLLKDGANEILVRAENAGSSAGLMAEVDLVKKSGEVVKVGTGADWLGGASADGPWSPVREFMRLPQPPYGETPYVDYETGTRTTEFGIDLASEPVPQAGRLVTSVRREKGSLRYFENGVERPYVAYRSPSAGVWRGGRHQFLTGMDRAGVRLAEISIPLGPKYWRADGTLDETGLEREMLSAFHCTSNMNLVCFFNVDAPAWYVKAHAADRYAFADGRAIDRMSYASEAYRRDTAAFLRRTVAYLKSRPYYGRIAGFGLDGGYDGQFMQWTDYGYKAMGDYSEPMKRLFGGEPPSADRRRGSAENLRLDPAKDADVIRYNRLFGSTPAEFLLACAQAVKEESANEKIVCAYYGKFYSLAGYLEAGELAIRRVLESPYVDVLIAVEYNQRAAGRPHSISAPTESYALHGKLFVDEADIRTFLDGQKNWGYAGDEKGTESMIRKMFAMSFVRGHAVHWYDLFGGWFAHPAIERMIADVQQVAARHAGDAVRPAEIAVVCDEESLIQATSAIKRETSRTTNHLQNGVLGRIGAPFDLYFADDLAAAPAYRLYVFLNCFSPTTAARAAIERIRASGAACVFVNPGDRVLAPAEYRARARQAGVHLVSEADDVMVYVGRGLLGVHAGSAGRKALSWPTKATFRDAITREPVAIGVTRFELAMEKGETRLLDVLTEKP